MGIKGPDFILQRHWVLTHDASGEKVNGARLLDHQGSALQSSRDLTQDGSTNIHVKSEQDVQEAMAQSQHSSDDNWGSHRWGRNQEVDLEAHYNFKEETVPWEGSPLCLHHQGGHR